MPSGFQTFDLDGFFDGKVDADGTAGDAARISRRAERRRNQRIEGIAIGGVLVLGILILAFLLVLIGQ